MSATAKAKELQGAFAAGAYAHGASREWAEAAAKRTYPTPTVTRPREAVVMPHNHDLYRVREGVIEFSGGDGWMTSDNFRLGTDGQLVIDRRLLSPVYAGAIPKIIDLIRHPTETVEVEA